MSATIDYPSLRFAPKYDKLHCYIKKYQINMKLKKVWEGCTETEKKTALNAFDVAKELRSLIAGINIKLGDWMFQKLQEKGHTDAMGERQLERYNKLATLFWRNVLFPYQFRCRFRDRITKLFYDYKKSPDLTCRTETFIMFSSYIEDKLFKKFCKGKEDDWHFDRYVSSMKDMGWIEHVRPLIKSMEVVYQSKINSGDADDLKQLEGFRWKKYEKVREVVLSRMRLLKSGSSSSSNGPSSSSSSRKRKGATATSVRKKRKVQKRRWTVEELKLLKNHPDFKRALNDEVKLMTAAKSIQKSLFPKFDFNRVHTKLQKCIKEKKDIVLHNAVGALMMLQQENSIE